MGRALRYRLWFHMRQHAALYLTVLVSLIVGVVIGSLSVGLLSGDIRQAMTESLRNYLAQAGRTQPLIIGGSTLLRALWTNLQTLVVIWLLGLTVFGVLAVPVVLVIRGFLIGFATAFLLYTGGWDGLLVVITTLLPADLMLLPGLAVLGVASLGLSAEVIRHRLARRPFPFVRILSSYFGYGLLASFLLGGASLLQGVLAPYVLSLLIPH